MVESGQNVPNDSPEQSTVVVIESIIWDAVLVLLNGGQCHVGFLPMPFVL